MENLGLYLLKHTYKPLLSLLHTTPALYLISYSLQSLFLSLALTSLMAALMTLLTPASFSPQPILSLSSQMPIPKLLLTIALFLFQVWQHQSPTDRSTPLLSTSALAYLCCLFLGLYIYDACARAADCYVKNVRGYYWGQVGAVVVVGGGLGIGLGCDWVGLWAGVIGFGLVVTVGKNCHIAYTAIPGLLCLMIPYMRQVSTFSKYSLNLPLQLLLVFPIALISQHAQTKQSVGSSCSSSSAPCPYSQSPSPLLLKKHRLILQLAKFSGYFLIYYAMSGRTAYIEIIVIWVGVVVELLNWRK